VVNFKSFTNHHAIIIGLFLMFFYTWTIDLSNSGVLPFKIPFAMYITLGWGFIFVSLFMTWLTLGKDEMVKLIKRVFIWRVEWKWYLVALLLLPALQLSSVLLTSWLTRSPVDYSHLMVHDLLPIDAPLLLMVVPWLLFEILTNGEEWGWRGYILPRLQNRFNALTSSLILGVIWSVWHLPKFFGTGASSGRSFFWFTIFSLAGGVLYTWLYNNSHGSLLLVTLFHAANNTAAMFLPVSFAIRGGFTQNMMVLLYILAAIIVTSIAGPVHLSRTEGKQVQE
jgi:membrane protease YdiL (CAAX protease family)